LRGNRPLVVIATIAVLMLLYWGEAFFVPLLIALLLSYALAPLVAALTIVVRFRAIAAALVVLSIIALGAVAVWAWSDDVERAWQKLPVAAKTLSKSLQRMAARPGSPVQQVQKAAKEVESIAHAAGSSPAAAAPPAQPAAQPASMPMWQVLWRGWKSVMAGATQVMVVLFLMFFMLASGDLFKRKLMAIAGNRLSQQKDALRVIEEIDQQIRRYLGVLLVSNLLVGLATWGAFWLLGVEYPGLWGLAAAVLHTAPYFGPAIIAFASLIAAFLQFDEWSRAFIVSGTSILVASLVGMVLQTWLASRTSRMNATAVFIGLLFFGWLWDLWGVLLAIPILAIVKTICERNDNWKSVAELLGR